ncbi:purple acid phosphatase family protein [Streptomyces beihaiensis]|uniref:Metallophosphoesterase family protein n=1 Tax=Streptomyces beihaiensis TaxID=2984495 RepID=A0ABT3TRW6_9ACTN|nr:metallophosphoesterase family protein [Streptomyces beihaiensis]MCX3059520.1 metallophosphoesterase family protein [Streptomyces beihaiensis]
MNTPVTADSSRLSRRTLIAGASGAGLAGAVGAGLGSAQPAAAVPGPLLWRRPGPSGAPRVAGLHLQFGSDASREIVVSWHTTSSVSRPKVLLGTAAGGFGRQVAARTTTYRDAHSGTEVQIHHAAVRGLRPDTDYVYAAVHDGAQAELGTVRTAPRGRAPFTFTSFGDQGTPTLGRKNDAGVYVNDNLGSPFAGDTTAGVERIAPLFHLMNGDLCYANLATDRVRTWSDWFETNTRSARHRPWMPAPGNHENELGNGPIGYAAYQSYFDLPDSGAHDELRGLWYAFTAGSVRVISLANDDVALQDGGSSYVHGYSGGAQRRWLETELAAARADADIDWIVVCMHQVAISTADKFNGADLGVREQWLPLFDRYGVDLVVCGHEHHYERSHPIRGHQADDTRTPVPAATDTRTVDTTKGTVHMVIGGGGTSVPSNELLFPTPECRVIVEVGDIDPETGKRKPVYVHEDAPWSAVRDGRHPYGFAAFEVDPGSPGGDTSIHVTYYSVSGPYGALTAVDRFTLTRPRGRH